MDIIAGFMKPVSCRFPRKARLNLMIVGDCLLDHVDPFIGAHMGVVEVDIARGEFGELQVQLFDALRLHRRAGQLRMGQRVGEGAQQLFLLPTVETRPVGGEGAGDRCLDLCRQRPVVILKLAEIGYGYAQRLRHRRLVHPVVQAELAQARTCEDTVAACHLATIICKVVICKLANSHLRRGACAG